MKLLEVEGKIIQECNYENDVAKILLSDGTILEFEMNLKGNPPILDVYLTKPGKTRMLY